MVIFSMYRDDELEPLYLNYVEFQIILIMIYSLNVYLDICKLKKKRFHLIKMKSVF